MTERESPLAPLEHDAASPLNELSETLVLASALLARLKRSADAAGLATEVDPLDEAFTRAIALTRTVRERVLVRRARSDYASLTSAVREIVDRVERLPEGLTISGRYPTGAAIVAADGVHLRRLVQALIELALYAVTGAGNVEAEVIDTPQVERARRAIRLDIRTSAEIDELDPRLLRVRPLVHALTGTLQVRAPIRGGTILSLRLLAAC